MFERKSIQELKKELEIHKAKLQRDSNYDKLQAEIAETKAKRRALKFAKLRRIKKSMDALDKNSGVTWKGFNPNV